MASEDFAASLTREMLAATLWAPVAACVTLRAISWVAARCCSTAAEIAPAMGVHLDDDLADAADRLNRLLRHALHGGDLATDLVGRLGGLGCQVLTSDATTAKPLPASPARAASMVAFKARRLVWLATSLIMATTSPIFCAADARPWTVASVRWAASEAWREMVTDFATWPATSAIEAESSSAAPAAV